MSEIGSKLTITYLTPFSSVFIADFKEVNVSWITTEDYREV